MNLVIMRFHVFTVHYYCLIILLLFITSAGHSHLYTRSRYVSNMYIVAATMWSQIVLHVMLFPLLSALYS